MCHLSRTALFAALLALAPLACSGERAQDASEGASSGFSTELGEPLYEARATPARPEAGQPRRSGIPRDPIIIPDCRLTIIEKQEVPSQREGVILFIGTEVQPGEDVPVDRQVTVRLGGELKMFRRLKEDDRVEAGQLLARLDDRLARDDLAIKNGKLAASKADLASAEKTRDEARNRYETQLHLHSTRSTSSEEVRAAKLTWERYIYECASKREAVRLADLECHQSETVLAMHEIRSSIPGVVKAINKKRGEAVRNLEPVFQIHDMSKLRIEGLVELEYRDRVRKGLKVVIEPSCAEGPEQTLLGHLQEVTAVAVTADPHKPAIVSASEDGTIRVWEHASRHERRVLSQNGPVRCLACGPTAATARWCLAGGSDGAARLWDLTRPSEEPAQLLQGEHRGGVTSVAFSPDGKACVTAGEDREICLWDTSSGALRYRFPPGHRAVITALQFTPQSQLVSAGRDNTVRIWTVGTKGARLDATIDRRSGDVTHPGISPDGRFLLLDQGRALRMLTLRDQLTECVLENPGEASQFTTFAQFSPDGRLILTAGAAEGRVQLWRAPTPTTRPYEVRQLVTRDRSPSTCAAFAANGAFVVTGTKDHQVLIWSLPSPREVEEQSNAEITLVEQAVESSTRQVRIWAEVANAAGRLLPGTTVTLAIYP